MLQWTGICTYINKHSSGLYVCMYGRMDMCVGGNLKIYVCKLSFLYLEIRNNVDCIVNVAFEMFIGCTAKEGTWVTLLTLPYVTLRDFFPYVHMLRWPGICIRTLINMHQGYMCVCMSV